jgi:aminoglycoside 6'-N-acetyltransferase
MGDPVDFPTLVGDRVTVRPVRPGDIPALAAIVVEPAVARWWGMSGLEHEPDDMLAGLAVVVDGVVQGRIEVAEEDDPTYRHVALDVFLATAAQGRGLGPEALRLVIRHFIARGHHRFTIDPAAANDHAIRAYARLGFRPVGVMRRYERGADGTWHDGLLMDLLADELR